MNIVVSKYQHIPITKTLSKLIASEIKIEIQPRISDKYQQPQKFKKGVADYIETTMHNKPIKLCLYDNMSMV